MEDSNWIYMIEKIQDIKLFSRLIIQHSSKEYEIPVQHLDILSQLAITSEKITPMSLSKSMGINKTIISRTIDTLNKKGYLTKIKDENDKRSYFISITEEGRKQIEKIYEHHLSPIYELKRRLGDEMFFKLMKSIETANIKMQEKGKGE